MDVMTDEGAVVRQHIYRVRDALDAHQTVQRHRATAHPRVDTAGKRILVDLPTDHCQQFLKLQVCGLHSDVIVICGDDAIVCAVAQRGRRTV